MNVTIWTNIASHIAKIDHWPICFRWLCKIRTEYSRNRFYTLAFEQSVDTMFVHTMWETSLCVKIDDDLSVNTFFVDPNRFAKKKFWFIDARCIDCITFIKNERDERRCSNIKSNGRLTTSNFHASSSISYTLAWFFKMMKMSKIRTTIIY